MGPQRTAPSSIQHLHAGPQQVHIPKWDYTHPVRVIAVSTLKSFWSRPEFKDSEMPLRSWLEEVRDASWQHPADIKAQFAHASILKSRRVVFNIKGNDYRLVVAVAYRYQSVYIKFVGTHAQYNTIDVMTVEVSP